MTGEVHLYADDSAAHLFSQKSKRSQETEDGLNLDFHNKSLTLSETRVSQRKSWTLLDVFTFVFLLLT